MFIRIVKMSFEQAQIPNFLSNFEANKNEIRNFDGCLFLELYRDRSEQNVFFTYSYWQDESFLEAYRQSELFKNVWSKTKLMFNAKPQAWSVDKIVSLP